MPIHRFTPKIEFRYRANGKDFTTEAASVYTADTYQQAAANLARLYAPGTHHPIRYNPGDPNEIQFGVISFGPLAFSFLLLVAGVVLSTVGLRLLAEAYFPRAEPAPAVPQGVAAPVLPFTHPARGEAMADTLRCPACGRPVKPTEETCPNCLRFLRAA